MTDLAKPMCSLPVQPEGSKRLWANFSDQELERNACWSESETAVAEGRRPISVYPAWIRRRHRPQERRIEKAPLDE